MDHFFSIDGGGRCKALSGGYHKFLLTLPLILDFEATKPKYNNTHLITEWYQIIGTQSGAISLGNTPFYQARREENR